jgi:hypothetical protein
MADNEKRFLNYENSMSIYRSKTALIIGTLYFSKGYQSTPVLGMQFASVVDPDADQKTFNWDSEEKVWYFPTYDKVFELYRKISKWKAIVGALKTEKVTDSNAITERYKDFANQNKIANPLKKKTMYLSVSYYNGYFLKFSFTTGTKDSGGSMVQVSLHEDEMEMLVQYIGDFVRNYHNLGLLHRTMNIQLKQGNGSESKRPYSPPSTGRSSSDESQPAPPKSTKSVDDVLGESGSSLDDIMNSLNTGQDDDIPF